MSRAHTQNLLIRQLREEVILLREANNLLIKHNEILTEEVTSLNEEVSDLRYDMRQIQCEYEDERYRRQRAEWDNGD